MKKRLRSLLTAAAVTLSMMLSAALPISRMPESFSASAVSTDYPPQLMNIAVKDNSKALTENGTTDNSSLTVKALGNDLSPSWRFDRVGADSNGTFFKITNAQSGRLLTPKGYKVSAGTEVVVYGSESDKSQHWYAVPVKTDRLGNNLHYKIVNYSNTSLALTQSSGKLTLASYTGADSQLWLLNSDGLQGFAGYCNNDNTKNIKASNIGGLFGEVVEVTSFNDLKKYAESDTPYTIVVTKNISVTDLNLNGERYMCSAGRIYVRSNKTIIGSYNAHTTFNVQFCTSSGKGVGNNIIIKNFEMQHDAESNNNDSIVCYFGSGENIWVDHVTFTGHSNYGYAPKTGQVDEDKFLACCYDADYCTVSDCSFGGHKYGLILGYPDSSASNKDKYDGYPRMTLAGNKFYDTNTRAPGLMRWGYYHSFNNYVNKFSMGYTVQANCRIYAENCVYENGGNVICDWNLGSGEIAGSYAESGSSFSGCGRTVQGQGTTNNPSYSKACSWRPTSNYDYVKLTAAQAKTYTSSYSGCQTSKGNMMYLRFGSKGVPSAAYSEAPSGPVIASFVNGSTFRIKNASSGLYMQVKDAAAENGANVQQWGSDGTSAHDVWKLISAGDGYYYIISAVGDGGTYALDVDKKATANGTNIDIYNYNGGINQQFMFAQNSDGSYKILTKVTGGASAVEVKNNSAESGENIQQWELNGAACQNWYLESAANPGCAMDISLIYEFKNVNSGMVMDIAGGNMADGTNVQQWGSNGYNCQKWVLKSFGSGNYYYIRSLEDQNYVLKANGSTDGSNISIVPYSGKDNAMLFRFSKNPDGSYYITTHASSHKCYVEVASASKDSGANVQQWQNTGSDCQKWTAVTYTTTKAPVVTTTTTTTAAEATTTTTENTTNTTTDKDIVVTTVTTTTSETPTETETIIIGDADLNGTVTIEDYVILNKILLGIENITSDKQRKTCDINDDKMINIFDSILLKRILMEQK